MDDFDSATNAVSDPDTPSRPLESNQPAKPDRRPLQWAVPVLAMAVIVAVPWLAWALVPGSAVAAVVLVVCLLTAVIGGFWDGRTFRSSWTFPVAMGVAFWMAGNLYFNDGAWVYIPAMVALAAAAGCSGDRVSGRARAAGRATEPGPAAPGPAPSSPAPSGPAPSGPAPSGSAASGSAPSGPVALGSAAGE